jgi:nucleoside-diphosphate-sugar epimerase
MFTKDKIATIGVNTTTTIELFKLLKEGGSFLYISTSEVYSGAPLPHTEEAIGTTSPQHPRACYIEGKRCGEAITMAYRDMGVDAKIARLSLAYGEGTKKGDTRVMNQLIEKALTLGRIELMDRGDAIRTYCYVEDAVGMMLDILFKGTQPVYNVGGKDTLTIGELAFRIGEITRTEVTLGDKSIRGSPDTVQLDMSRTLFEFPREFVPLEEGLKRTIEYQKRLYGK